MRAEYRIGFIVLGEEKIVFKTHDKEEAIHRYTQYIDSGTPCRIWVGKRMLTISEADREFIYRANKKHRETGGTE